MSDSNQTKSTKGSKKSEIIGKKRAGDDKDAPKLSLRENSKKPKQATKSSKETKKEETVALQHGLSGMDCELPADVHETGGEEGTTASNPNPVSSSEKVSVLYHQPTVGKAYEWTRRVTKHALPYWISGDAFNDKDDIIYKRDIQFSKTGQVKDQYRSCRIVGPPLFVVSASMNGMGGFVYNTREKCHTLDEALKFKEGREYSVTLSPNFPKYLFQDNITVIDKDGKEQKMTVVEYEKFVEPIVKPGRMFISWLVEIYIAELTRQYNNPAYRIGTKEANRQTVMERLEVMRDPQTGKIVPLSKDTESSETEDEIQKRFEDECLKEYFRTARTPIGYEAGRKRETGPTFEISFNPHTMEEIRVEMDQDNTDLWYEPNADGFYGGKNPRLTIKRSANFGERKTAQIEPTEGDVEEEEEPALPYDRDGTVPWFELYSRYGYEEVKRKLKRRGKHPVHEVEDSNLELKKRFAREMLSFYYQFVQQGLNMAFTSFYTPFGEPLSEYAGRTLLEYDLRGGVVNSGSIVAPCFTNARTKCPGGPTGNFGIQAKLESKMFVYCSAPMSNAALECDTAYQEWRGVNIQKPECGEEGPPVSREKVDTICFTTQLAYDPFSKPPQQDPYYYPK